MKDYSHLTNPGIRSTKRRAGPWAYGMIMFAIRRYYALKERHELFWYSDTYDLARGLALKGHSSSPSLALAEQSGGRVLPFLDPSASPVGEAFLFFSPPSWGESSFSSSSSGEESASESSDDESDTT